MDSNLPVVSVVVPVYKVEKYLDKCVKSLLNQTYPNIEIVLVDDGSPDNCPILCDRYAEQYNNIKSCHKKNGGLGSARNYGVENAAGEWIVFVDSDDYVLQDYISYMMELRNKYNADMVTCGITKVDENGKELFKSKTTPIEKMNNREAFFAIYFARKSGHRSYSKLLKKSQILRHPFPAGYFEDFATTYLWLEDCDSVVFGDGAENYRYVQRPGSILNSTLNEKHLHAFEICDDICAYIDQNCPEFSKYKSLLYQGQVVQMLNKQNMSNKEFYDVYVKYRFYFLRNSGKIIFSNELRREEKLYRVLLCLTPVLYRCIRRWKQKIDH